MSQEGSGDEVAPELERVRVRVVDWLVAEGWQTAAGTGEGAAWALRGQDPGGKVVIFALERQPPHRLVLHASVRLDESHADKLSALEGAVQDDLCWGIRLKLLDMRVDFQGVALPLSQINLRMRLYTDEMTRTSFFDTVGTLQNAMLYVIWTVRRVLDQPALQDDEPDLRIN